MVRLLGNVQNAVLLTWGHEIFHVVLVVFLLSFGVADPKQFGVCCLGEEMVGRS